MRKPRIPLFAAAAALVLCSALPLLQAQPDPNNAPKAENPPNWQRGNRGGRNMTPEQRAERRRQARRQQLKNAMNANGLADAAVQETVLAFADENERERQKLSETFQALNRSFRNVGRGRQRALATDEEIGRQLQAVRDAVKAEKERRARAEAALDEKVRYTQNPRLEAFLTSQGLIGDEAGYSMAGAAGGLGFQGGRGQFGGGAANNNNRARPRNRGNAAPAAPGNAAL